MFRKEVNPIVVLAATVLILVVVQFVYWRGLVYREPARGGPGGGGGGGGGITRQALGRADVTVSTIAGDEPGFRDGTVREARFAGPNALAVGPDGAILVSDSRNHRIRRVIPGGEVTTIAGAGPPGGVGARGEGPVNAARFSYPSGVALARDGTLYVSDTGNHRVCRIKDGQVSTLAGGTAGQRDGAGSAAAFQYPGALTVGPDGAVWVADAGNQALRRVTLNGAVSSPAEAPGPVADALGDLYRTPLSLPISSSPNGADAAQDQPFTTKRRSPGALLPGPGLHIFADPAGCTVHSWKGSGSAFLLAGRREDERSSAGIADGEGARAQFTVPCAVALGPDKSLYVADYGGNRIRRVELPEWLLEGTEMPVRQRRRFRRSLSGN